jgi:hypothetical protein
MRCAAYGSIRADGPAGRSRRRAWAKLRLDHEDTGWTTDDVVDIALPALLDVVHDDEVFKPELVQLFVH